MEHENVISSRPFHWQGSILQILADGGYALSRFAPPLAGGQVWQGWAQRMMTAVGAHQVQGPGSLHLFSYPSASGLRHEIDAAGILDVAVALEAKDQECGIGKNQVDSFDGRTFDYFESAIQHGKMLTIYRIMWSTSPLDPLVRCYAARKGIIMIGPDRIPLPSILAATERWDATDWLPDQHLADLVLLGERACQPLKPTLSGRAIVYQYSLTLWRGSDLDDLDYLHDLASVQWLDWLDRTTPLYFEQHAERCLQLVSGWSELRDPIN